jgi:hypothetical protein
MIADWISVKERLPELGQEVLVMLQGGARTLARLDENGVRELRQLWVDREAVRYALWCVTHWLPLPVGDC